MFIKPINFLFRNAIPKTSLLITLIFCINKLGFNLSGGEEQYLAFSKQFVDPNWIKNSFSLTEFAGTRLVFQLLVGSILYFFDFDTVVFFGRLVNFFLLSIPLALIFQKLNLKWGAILVITQLFVMSKQSFFGGEWIVGGLEPKTLAYVFLFYSIYYVHNNQVQKASLHLIISTYFHFLVGGWLFLCLLIYYVVHRDFSSVKKIIKPYIIGLFPLLIYLCYGYFLSPKVVSEHNLNWVYCYYRLPHHLGLFNSMDTFITQHLVGIIITAMIFFLSLLLRKKIPQSLRLINSFIVIITTINLFFVAISWLDVNYLNYAASSILKFYPFRMNSLAMFFSIIIGIKLLFDKLNELNWGENIQYGLISVIALLGIIQGINNIKRQLKYDLGSDYIEMCTYIKNHTLANESFILINMNIDSPSYNAFMRLTERENYSIFKFVSAEKNKLNEWYNRQLLLNGINKNNKKLKRLNHDYDVTYALSKGVVEGKKLVKQVDNYYLYSLKDNS